MQTAVTLADGTEVMVKRLGLFELHDAQIGPADPGDFTYTVRTVSGTEYQATYDLQAALQEPPERPDDPDDTWAMTEWERYRAAIAHHQERMDIAQRYEQGVADYILAHCVEAGLRDRLTADDYLSIYKAALCPQLTVEDLAGVLDSVFPGQI